MTGRKFPKVLGGDFAGTILETEDKKNFFKTGDKIYGFANLFLREQGSLAEFTVISPKYVRKIPKGMDPKNACAITSAGLTALNGIRKCGDIKGKNVLVNGATGGVGHFATQIFLAKGAKITAVCSSRNVEIARKMGVNQIIDYTKESPLNQTIKYDIIFDAAAKFSYFEARKHLNKKGIYCTTEESGKALFSLLASKFYFSNKMCISGFRGTTDEFEEMEALITEGSVKPILSHTYPFTEVDKAFDMLENGGPYGKIIVNINNNSEEE